MGEIAPEDRVQLLRLVRDALNAQFAGWPPPPVPAIQAAHLRRGAFVTLTEDGALRGCIGRVTADRPLGEVVRELAVAAALDDPRFSPVTPDELPHLRIEISVLTTPAPSRPEAVVVGRDGVIVRQGDRMGLLLPQVAKEQHWSAEELLSGACRKAGLQPWAWRDPDTEMLTFEAEVFGEEDGEGRGGERT